MGSFWPWRRRAPASPPAGTASRQGDDPADELIPWIVAFHGHRGEPVEAEWVRSQLKRRAADRRHGAPASGARAELVRPSEPLDGPERLSA